MKIAIVTETFLPQVDGIVTRLCATIRWLTQEGYEVLVIAPGSGVTEFEGAKVVGIPAHSFFFYRDKQLSFPNRKVGRYLKEFEPDLVHVVNPAMIGVAGIYYARRKGWPLVASYHTHIPKYADYYRVPFLKPVLWWYFRFLHNRADLNLCTSQTVLSELKSQHFQNVQVWKRGVNTKQFSPSRFDPDMRKRLMNGETSKTLLLYVGRLAAEKEIEKIRDVLDQSSDLCLALVGDGPHRSYLEQYFKGTNTVFTGFLHGESLARAYASSDIFVFPSTTETLGLVILEAMASGLPIVAARSGPTREQIEDRVSGMLYDPDSQEDFVCTVLKLRDPALRVSISKKTQKISKALGWEESSSQLAGFYRQILRHPKGVWASTPARERSDVR